MNSRPVPDELAEAVAQVIYDELAASLQPVAADGTADPVAINMAADTSDEATYDLLSVTFDEDEGEVIEWADALKRRADAGILETLRDADEPTSARNLALPLP
ncbi:hypothetical protein [uncultured Enterovirga sp.]|uniref:hypothetical protein n=1 Tax=uncultured Enterovirga sp. TaxID=2026352 RepID=UPI0035CAB9D6